MLNYFELIRDSHLKTLETANALFMRGAVQTGMPVFQKALKKDIIALYHQKEAQGEWLLDSDNKGYDYVVLMLAEYYMQSRQWSDWQRLVKILETHPQYPALNPDYRVRIAAISHFGAILNATKLKNSIKVLSEWVLDPQIDDISRGISYFVLGRAYTQVRNEQAALETTERASQYCSENNAPFYQALIQESYGTIFYFINQGRRSYFERAIQLYSEAEAFTRSMNNGLDFAHNPYNLGWVYGELGDYEQALFHFERGYSEALSTHAHFESAQYEYGMGYIYLMLKQFDKALELLQDAVFFFATESYAMTATCLNLIAAVLHSQERIDDALERLLDAVSNLERADHPVQLHHVYRQLSFIYRDKQERMKALKYLLLTYRLRVQYGYRLWPY